MHGVPMRIAKLSAQNLIDTLGDNDFFNVVYVSILSVIFLCSDFGVHIVGAWYEAEKDRFKFPLKQCSSCGNINSKIENLMKIK